MWRSALYTAISIVMLGAVIHFLVIDDTEIWWLRPFALGYSVIDIAVEPIALAWLCLPRLGLGEYEAFGIVLDIYR